MAARKETARTRVTDEEKAHLEKVAAEGGFKHLSDYMREVLLSTHVIVVGNAGMILVPAFTEDETKRAEALENLRALETRASEPAVELTPPDPGEPPSAAVELPSESAAGGVLPPIAPEPQPVPQMAPPPPPAQTLPPAPPVPPQLPQQAPQRVIYGPQLQAGENQERFVNRRRWELQAQGRSAVIAVAEADAEWRAIEDGIILASQQPAEPEPMPAPPPPQQQPPTGELPGEDRTWQPGDRPRSDLPGSPPETAAAVPPMIVDIPGARHDLVGGSPISNGAGTACVSCGAVSAGAGTGFCSHCGATNL